MKNLIRSSALVVGLFAATIVHASTLEKFGQVGKLASIEESANSAMISMLERAKTSIAKSSDNITILRVVCPDAMLAIASIGVGKTDVDTGAKLFMSGLISDRSDMISSRIMKNERLDLAGTDVTINFTIIDRVSKEALIEVIEAGQRFLSR